MRLEYQSDLESTPSTQLNNSGKNFTSFVRGRVRNETKIPMIENIGKRKNNPFSLKKLVTKHKVKILTKNFIAKLNRNNPFRNPPEKQFQEVLQQSHFYSDFFSFLRNTEGLFLGNLKLSLWSLINIFQITIMVFVFSIMVAFQETKDNELFFAFKFISEILYLIDMILNFLTQRFENGKKVTTLYEIGDFYIKSGFFIDMISILTFLIDLLGVNFMLFSLFVTLIKLYNNFTRFERYEYLFFKTSGQEIYFGLFKVFLINFSIAHFLSILLNLMTLMQENLENTWCVKVNICRQEWFIKYIWGYYWGTNIMLTVGFGDLAAQNHWEAMVLIFVETFSCITLAYNISNVGCLIGNLRARNAEKHKMLKTFHRMSSENQIPFDLNSRVINFIEESFQIKQFFEFDEEDKVVNSLPKGIQSEYRVEANKILFDSIGFFKNLSKKSLILLAESVQRKITHPDQIYRKKGSSINFSVIFKGSYGLCYKKPNSSMNGTIIQQLQILTQERPRLISLDFIKNKYNEYDIKSLTYGIIFCLQKRDFMNCLRETDIDYEFFCTMKDKDENIMNENEIYKCSHCKNEFHNKFNCSRMHFMPIKQHVVNTYIWKNHINKRVPFVRPKCHRKNFSYQKSLKERSDIDADLKKYMVQKFSKSYMEKIENLWKYSYKVNRIRQIKKEHMMINASHLTEDEGQSIEEKTLTIEKYSTKGIQNIQKLLMKSKSQFAEFWDLETELAHNYKYYFRQSNPDLLKEEKSQNMNGPRDGYENFKPKFLLI